jgi:ABC-type multidrug transport system ATPase subunit
VIDDISLKLTQNEITALLGNNGAGKTTLIKMLLGEMPLKKDSGEIIITDG